MMKSLFKTFSFKSSFNASIINSSFQSSLNRRFCNSTSLANLARDYINAYNGAPKDIDKEKLMEFWDKDIKVYEYPSMVIPNGDIYTYSKLFEGLAAGEQVLKSQTYIINELYTSNNKPNTIIIELTWNGLLNMDIGDAFKIDDTMVAEITIFLDFDDKNKIVNQRNYSCYHSKPKIDD
mmetsp:Transcript_48787/g.59997  ORF Transcript_48787/g.59997 Transcript_48787/m.59997 type:complete len:179 (-) Transcript_48787:86-622(-)